jgi:quercetin dioxygenase-like cupin family protein
MSSRIQPGRIRRIVTAQDAAGRAVVERDELVTGSLGADGQSSSVTLWVTDASPAPIGQADGGVAEATGTTPPEGGTRLGVLELAPGREAAGLHRTDTVDYVICIEGVMTMVLDEQTVEMRPGDVLVQRGAAHGWCNRSRAPARIAFIMLDAAPKREGSLSGTQRP